VWLGGEKHELTDDANSKAEEGATGCKQLVFLISHDHPGVGKLGLYILHIIHNTKLHVY